MQNVLNAKPRFLRVFEIVVSFFALNYKEPPILAIFPGGSMHGGSQNAVEHIYRHFLIFKLPDGFSGFNQNLEKMWFGLPDRSACHVSTGPRTDSPLRICAPVRTFNEAELVGVHILLSGHLSTRDLP